MDQHTGTPAAKTAEQYRQTADEHVRTLKDFWKDFLVSGLFVLAAIVIIFACLAWFAANNSVNATGSSISAKGSEFALLVNLDDDSSASKGVYENEKHGLSTADAMLVDNDSNFNNNSGGANTEIGPGSAGKLKLKIHRYNKSITAFKVTISLAKSASGSEIQDNTKLAGLLDGHIQFFEARYENGYYGQLLLPDAKSGKRELTVNFENDTDEEKSFTVYWVWPMRLSNIIAPGGSRYDSGLFAEKNADYDNLLADLSAHKSRYFDSTDGIPDSISNDMDNSTYTTCSNEYDAADDYVGSNVQYVQVRFEGASVKSSDASSENGGQ